MKRLTALIIVLLLFAAGGCGSADNSPQGFDSISDYKDIPGVTEEEIAYIKALKQSRGAFTYGHTIETEAFPQPDGTYAGFTPEVCELLSGLFGVEFKTVCYDEWSDMKTALDNGEIDFSGGLMVTEERKKLYHMTFPIAGRSLKAYTPDNGTAAEASDLNGKKIGVLFGTVLLDAVEKVYPEYAFEAVLLNSYDEGVAMLESGDISAIVATSAAAPRFDKYDTVKPGDFFSLAYYPVSVTASDSELEPIISVINKYILSGGNEKFSELYREGEFEYRKSSLQSSFTEAEKRYLEQMITGKKSVKIGITPDAYPDSFYNETEREYQGIAVDVLEEVSRLTGLEFEPISETTGTPLPALLSKLKSGEISMILKLLKTDSRKNDYLWSETPYITTNFALLSREELADIEVYQVPWARVGTINQSAYEEMFRLWFPEYQNSVSYENTDSAFEALENGEIDLLMYSETLLLQQTNLREKTGYKVNVRFDKPVESYFGFSKSETVLRSIIDKALRRTDIAGIANEWTDKSFDYSNKIIQMQAMYLLYFSCTIIMIAVALLYLLLRNRRLGEKLRERTTTLSTVYTSIPDAIFSKDTEGRYTSCNPSFEVHTGMIESEIVGKTYTEVFGERVTKTQAFSEETDRKIMSARIMSIMEETVIFPDGSRRQMEALRAPLMQNDVVIGLLGIGRDVTERNEMVNRIKTIVDTAQVAYVMSVDGVILETNEYCRNHIGTKIGDDASSFYNTPGQREELIELTERYGTSSNNIVKFNMANGEVHRFLANITLYEYEQRKAYILWALDIEQDEKRNDLLNEMQMSFQKVLDTLPMPIRIFDLESDEIVYVNKSLVELLGYDSADELCGKNISAVLHETQPEGVPHAKHIEAVIGESDAPVSHEVNYMTKAGNVIEAMVAARQIDYKGRRSSIAIIRDMSEEKERAQVLLNAVEREKEANQTKSQFLANMSHEIRTPMNGIIGLTDMLLSEHLSERHVQYISGIKTSAESLLGIINDILDLSKISEGRLQISPVDADLRNLLDSVVSMMRFSAGEKGLEFIAEINIDTPEYVFVDDIRLNQIIVNIISNAIKFTREGHVKLAAKIEGDNIVFEVSDTGIGIKEEDIPLIFSAFEQVDKNKNRAIKGTGLGLSITMNLVELMGGNIKVQSVYGEGTTFIVTIPYVPGDASAVEVKDSGFKYLFAPNAKVLLVDDIRTNLTVGAGLLRLCGITADVAASGQEALDLVSAREYDIVFMDHMMPEMDGIETMEAIRKKGGKYLELPIIALTANAVNASRDLLLSSGMDDFLSKPIDKSKLMSILQKWLPEDKIESRQESMEKELETPASETLTALSRTEGLDIELALSRIGGLSDVLEDSIRQVAFSIDGKLKLMDDSLSNGDLRSFATEAHGLKGALANIGATRNSELAAELEIAAKAEKALACIESFAVFASVMEEFAVELKKGFSTSGAGDRPSGDTAFLGHKIEETIDYLENFEAADALDSLKELNSFTFGQEADTALEEATNSARSFSYSKAIELLKQIRL